MRSYLVLPFLVLPDIHLNILIFATMIFFHVVFLIDQHSTPSIIVGLIAVSENFPFNLVSIRLSQSTLEASLHFNHLALILFLTSLSISLSLLIIEPR